MEKRKCIDLDMSKDVEELFTPAEREYMDTKMALAILEQMYREGYLNDKIIKNIRADAQKRLERIMTKC